jgi:electron transport complex protein RnfB
MDQYEQLRKILDKHLAGAPPSKKFDQILRILFTPEEVGAALAMIFTPTSVSAIAAKAGVSLEEAGALCESMANKGIVFSREKSGVMEYSLLPTIPGLFEFPFMKGGGEPMHQALAKLWEEYHRESLGNSFAGSQTPITRVIPIEKAIDARVEVLPFEVISKMLERNDTYALAQCACRVSVGACDKPKDVCLVFDKTARYLIERGFAREITRKEALDVVRRAEESGLVHTTNNSRDRLNLICNCCPCCCTIMRGLTQLKNPNAFAVSRWQSQVDADLCTGCGICEDERCPVSAITVKGSVAVVDQERCIGCGLCVTACDVEAVCLVPRQHVRDTPQTLTDMALQITAEKGTTADFMKLMNR